jgi:hypothetical protein
MGLKPDDVDVAATVMRVPPTTVTWDEGVAW